MFDALTQSSVGTHMELRDLIIDRRKRLGWTQTQLAEKAGVKQQDVTRIESGLTRHSKHEPAIRRALGISQDEIGKAVDQIHAFQREENDRLMPTIGVQNAPVRGETAAGVWLEHDYVDQGRYDPIPFVPTRYGRLPQFAFKVTGRSMEREAIYDGDYVVCVEYKIARGIAVDGDVVVAERRRGGLLERSCKYVARSENGDLILTARSNEPIFSDPIPLESLEEDTLIEIVGLVVGSYRPRR